MRKEAEGGCNVGVDGGGLKDVDCGSGWFRGVGQKGDEATGGNCGLLRQCNVTEQPLPLCIPS
jgi:hypothetical protein